jgi:micrococcal nuclease
MSRPLTLRDRLLILMGSRTRTLVILTIVGLVVLNRSFLTPATPPAPLERETLYVVERTIDGDTLLLEGKTRVRLIGVDTPELAHNNQPTEPFGKEAAQWLDERVTGRKVRLEFDFERYDPYGRTLAYVSLDDVLLNEEIIRQGYSRAQLQYNYSSRMKKHFQRAESEARKATRGIWSVMSQ